MTGARQVVTCRTAEERRDRAAAPEGFHDDSVSTTARVTSFLAAKRLPHVGDAIEVTVTGRGDRASILIDGAKARHFATVLLKLAEGAEG